ncbi:arsenate reductase [Verticiella sediminum]|uniref:Arsenate reductase n=1 Tax=Verticiella sediminum TaxID=1247510 RepID=A0A556ALS2_9BURK|nr:arsenate reductase [Verticiella sediminum]TSH93827.1 arsenate reductase [Verticiella sediminum]
MADTIVYGLTRCDTCVKARKWLDQHQVAYTFVDYRDHPVDGTTLRDWAGKLGGWDKLVNRASTTWRGLTDAQKAVTDDAGWLALIAAHPTLVKRPVLTTPDGQVSVGFKAPVWAERFGK